MLPGVKGGSVSAINESGEMVGGLDEYAVLWHSDGSVVQLTTGFAGIAAALDINESGQAVGYNVYQAMLWNPDGSLINLCGLTSDDLDSTAFAINDCGQIVGEVYSGDIYHAVIWNPVPEPSSAIVLIGGMCCVLCLLRKHMRLGLFWTATDPALQES